MRLSNGVHSSALFVFLSSKKETARYDWVFAYLVAQEIPVPAKGFHCDFDTQIRKAIRKHYTDIPVYGCDTHFKRAIRA